MASNPPGACCFTGFRHEGTPEGEIKSIGNVRAYFSYPKDNKTPDKAVFIITDVFGLYNNSKLLADDFASNGYLTVVPDLFDGDQLPLDALETGKVNIQEWLGKHGTDKVDPIIEATIKHLREDLGIKKIGAAGYCFGGKYVVRFLKDGKLDAGYSAHPSFITKEELTAIEKPFSIAAAETDSIFTRELRHESEDILIKARQPYQINLFSGVVHGFAVRADLSKPENKFAKEQAFLQAVAWFNFHL
ncbi:hypothetical protein VTN96DRAFT_10069 [Rasamsonia emersonii]|uniref:Dienelactone hydrolase domain-containing protein n=1 Tax=Rasamsonia emersonii (strain ATCC 16479 / CBS 393.64 / IMI 116815) TaxID=1408163 RepID=A0A0F4YXK3_RASE3|nr:hypothetical protein T310_2916 [Rasamsonia emersonii CBS 393.64]KKA23037.1 hypothetical protein T310_2916 [Rasamsonia emersonii CBS 393.64]